MRLSFQHWTFGLPLNLVAIIVVLILNVLPAHAAKPESTLVVSSPAAVKVPVVVSSPAPVHVPISAPASPVKSALSRSTNSSSLLPVKTPCAPERSGLQVSAPEASAQSYLPKMTSQMVTYSRIRYALYFLWTFFDVVVIWLFLHFGWANKLAEFARARSQFLMLQVAIFVLGLAIYLFIAGLPLTYYSCFWLDPQP